MLSSADVRASQLDVDRYLTKPFGIDDLGATLRELLEDPGT